VQGPASFALKQRKITMATGAVDDLLVRLFLRLDAQNGPALILAIFIVAVCYLLQYNYALFEDLFFQPAPQHDQPVDDSLPTRKPSSSWRGKFSIVWW
jgi:hypothetical protein